MSHVSEGALHAYLDGALDEYPTGEARRVRAHLERCPVCAAALEEARALRDRTDRILAAPELDVSPPPFEEIKRLARSAPESGTGRRLRLYRLGWAASVVLALGAGWLLRGARTEAPAEVAVERSSDGRARVSTQAAASAATRPATGEVVTRGNEEAPAGPTRVADAGAGAADAGESVDVDAVGRTGAMADARTMDPPVAAGSEAAAETVRIAEVGTSEGAGSAGSAAPPAEALEGAPVLEATESAELPAERVAAADATVAPDDRAEAVGAAPSAADAERDEIPSPSAPRAALELQVGGATGLGVPGAFDAPVRRNSAEAADRRRSESDPGSLVVPGLEVLSIVWREEGVTPAGVRVLQLLEDGGTLELIHLPEGIDPASVEPAAQGVRELTVPREEGWLILRAEATEPELRELLRRLDAAPPA